LFLDCTALLIGGVLNELIDLFGFFDGVGLLLPDMLLGRRRIR
jgi:hypothetical protein